MTQSAHPDWPALTDSWTLAMRADQYADGTLLSYAQAVRRLAEWLAEHHPDTGPLDVRREHIRAWLVAIRETHSANAVRSWFGGLRHFFRFLVAEAERDSDPTEGIRTPPAGQPQTPILREEQLRTLLATCTGAGYTARRDNAIIRCFLDAGLRLAELAALQVDDVSVRDRMLLVAGKGTARSGPRRRAAPIGIQTARAVDRYLRTRSRHPLAQLPGLWLGDRNRGPLSTAGIDAILRRRADQAGLDGVHPHQLRHSWAHAFRAAGGSEGDLMVLGGWRSRSMLDRYGASVAADRAREAYHRLSLGDRL